MARCAKASIIIAVTLLLGATRANAWSSLDASAARFGTTTAFDSYFPNYTCDAPNCAYLSANGGQAYTSDYAVAYEWVIFGAADGEVISISATKPDGTVVQGPILTENYASNMPPFAEWTDQYGNIWYDPTGYGAFLSGVTVTCQTAGTWSINFYDNGTMLYSTPFTLSHNATGPLGITSPTDNQLVDLDQLYYTETNIVPFLAGSNTGNPIDWTSSLQYATSGGKGNTTDNRLFTTSSAQEHDETYQSEGGQVEVTASTTASDGSTVNDCVTFYVEGPADGIDDATYITPQLDGLYQQSSNYPSGGTKNLMTGIAEVESTYHQFLTPLEGNPDLFELFFDYQIAAKWPNESGDGGSHIGLMMDPVTIADAWNWLQNTSDGVNSTIYGFAGNKLPTATTYIKDIINGVKSPKIPGHIGLSSLQGPELENMALVLYRGAGLGPDLATTLTELYYIPACSTNNVVITNKGLQCQGGQWTWAPNSGGNPVGFAYANSVTSNLQ